MSTTRATAVVVASERHGDEGRDGGGSVLERPLNRFGHRRYDLTLEVRAAGRDAWQTTGTFRVPRRAENAGLLDVGRRLPPGLVLPVVVDDDGEVAIDWDAHLADPGRRAALREASDAERRRQGAAHVAGHPHQVRMQAAADQRLTHWVNAVRAGGLPREQFETTVEIEVQAGRIDPAAAAEARAALDADA